MHTQGFVLHNEHSLYTPWHVADADQDNPEFHKKLQIATEAQHRSRTNCQTLPCPGHNQQNAKEYMRLVVTDLVIMALFLAGTAHALSSTVAASSPMHGVIYFAEDGLIRFA